MAALIFIAALGLFSWQRPAKLNFAEAKPVAQRIRGPRQLIQFRPALRIQQIQLLITMSKAAQGYAEQPHFSLCVAVLAKQRQKRGENVRIKLSWISQCFRSSV